MLEGKQAALQLLSMLGLALLAAGLVIIGWLGLLACIVVVLVDNNMVSWGVALGIAALLSFAGAGALVLTLVLMRRSVKPLFVVTRRQLGPRRNQEIEANECSAPLDPCEQEVEAGRMAARAEYQVLRNSLHRRLDSPLIIGGVMLAGIAFGYLGRSRHQPKNPLHSGCPSAWIQILGSVPVLTSLWVAIHAASRVPADGGGKATAEKRHES